MGGWVLIICGSNMWHASGKYVRIHRRCSPVLCSVFIVEMVCITSSSDLNAITYDVEF
jgi:hypothetical protein